MSEKCDKQELENLHSKYTPEKALAEFKDALHLVQPFVENCYRERGKAIPD